MERRGGGEGPLPVNPASLLSIRRDAGEPPAGKGYKVHPNLSGVLVARVLFKKQKLNVSASTYIMH